MWKEYRIRALGMASSHRTSLYIIFQAFFLGLNFSRLWNVIISLFSSQPPRVFIKKKCDIYNDRL